MEHFLNVFYSVRLTRKTFCNMDVLNVQRAVRNNVFYTSRKQKTL